MKLKSMNKATIYGIGLIISTGYAFIPYGDPSYCKVFPLSEIVKTNPQVRVQRCHPAMPFEFAKLPLTDNHYLHPYKGIFTETFIVTIPQGQVTGIDGWVLIHDTLIHELIWQNVFLSKNTLQKAKKNPPVIKKGTVAVIAQTGYEYYYHWMLEVLGRLAFLEINGIEYDFLYVPTHAAYMKETLQMWGIPSEKIIDASDDQIVMADTLIVPSLISGVIVEGCPRLVHYIPPYIVQYVRGKLLQSLDQGDVSVSSKKLFISRQDAPARKIVNEDEIFALLEPYGFKRYQLSTLSVREQIKLFNNAEIIVGPLGSGLTNILFCNPDVRILELYQARRDGTIWNLSQMAGLRHHTCVKTTEFIDFREGQYDTAIPLEIIQELIATRLTTATF